MLNMKDIIPPLAIALTEVSIGHPFDTAKVLIQNRKKCDKLETWPR